jgi:hypothetical protein
MELPPPAEIQQQRGKPELYEVFNNLMRPTDSDLKPTSYTGIDVPGPTNVGGKF